MRTNTQGGAARVGRKPAGFPVRAASGRVRLIWIRLATPPRAGGGLLARLALLPLLTGGGIRISRLSLLPSLGLLTSFLLAAAALLFSLALLHAAQSLLHRLQPFNQRACFVCALLKFPFGILPKAAFRSIELAVHLFQT